MSKIQFILVFITAGFAAVNYCMYLFSGKADAVPVAPIVLSCIFLPLIFCAVFGKFAAEKFPVAYEALKWIYISVGLLYFVSFTVFSIVITRVPQNGDGAEVYIVFGCKTNGYEPSFMLRQRLDRAYELLSDNPEAVAVLSGGKGDDETVSEAECMRAYLEAHGISGKRLIKEDRSSSTRENIIFSMRIIDEADLSGKKISAVSNDFHIKRILFLSDRLGYEFYASPSKTPAGARLWQNLIREYMVWVRYAIGGVPT